MIRYALICSDCETGFEAWFASSSAYDEQSARGLVSCPACGGTQVAKQIMAPAVAASSGRGDEGDMAQLARKFAAAAREHVAKNFDYVGRDFAHEARAMYYGEVPERAIWGATTADEAKALKEEGIPAAPLPAPFVPALPKSPDEPVN